MSRYQQTAISSLDSYKLGHADQYPVGIEKVVSNFTARSLSHFNVPQEYKRDNSIVWVGTKSFLEDLKYLWDVTFFNRPNWKELEQEAQELFAPFCGPNGFNVSRLKDLWDLGFLPLEIRALPEGSIVPVGVPVLTITNTLPAFAWLPNFLEAWISAELWKMPTSATTARVYRNIIDKYIDLTGGSKEFVQWQIHDFSVRGMSGIADAAKSGVGPLCFFTGTDNIPAVKLINDVYGGKQTFVGGSVPATEHSVMCAGGKESEVETFRRLLKTYPSGVVSIVSDTWDFWNVITNTASELKEEILARVPDQFGLAKTVFRPDSGDPVKIICGYNIVTSAEVSKMDYYDLYDSGYEVIFDIASNKYYLIEYQFDKYDGSVYDYELGSEIKAAEALGAVECLASIFGVTVNENGFKTLNPRVGLIYGDSITPQRCEQMLAQLMAKGYASDNVVFGVGSFTYQYQTRDTLGFAMKATYVEIDGVGQEIFKDPVTDSGTKKSAKGLVAVRKEEGVYTLYDQVSKWEFETSELKPVFLDGAILTEVTIAEIRDRLGYLKF